MERYDKPIKYVMNKLFSSIKYQKNQALISLYNILLRLFHFSGKYRRVLSLSNEAISTLNPNTMEATNSWKLSDIVSAQPLNAPGTNSY